MIKIKFNKVYFNTVHLGKIIKDVDGFYYFWIKEGSYGSWNSYSLRLIADKLDQINKRWNNNINEYFKNNDTTRTIEIDF
jgi:hypothetical protein